MGNCFNNTKIISNVISYSIIPINNTIQYHNSSAEYDNMTIGEYKLFLKQEGFDISDFIAKDPTDEEFLQYQTMAYTFAERIDAQKYPIKWKFNEKFRNDCRQKYLKIIYHNIIKDQLKEHCGL